MYDSDISAGPEHLDTLKQQVRAVLDEARAQGASACEVRVVRRRSLFQTLVDDQLGEVSDQPDVGFGVKVMIGQQQGTVIRSGEQPLAVAEVVGQALELARDASPQPHAALAEPERLAWETPDLGLYHDGAFDPAAVTDRLERMAGGARATDSKISSVRQALFRASHCVQAYGNSHGFVGGYADSVYQQSCVVRAADGQSGRNCSQYDLHRNPLRLMRPEEVGRMAAQKAVDLLAGQALEDGDYRVICGPQVGSEVLGGLIKALQGKAVVAQESFLGGRLGEALFRPSISIEEWPTQREGLGSLPFDADGVAVQHRAFVQHGRLVSYALSAETARQLQLDNTGSSVDDDSEIARNLAFNCPTVPRSGLLTGLGSGILVTETQPMQLDLGTGDFSFVALGFKVVGGQIGQPLKPFVASGNLLELFSGILEVGDDQPTYGRICSGSLLIERLTLRHR